MDNPIIAHLICESFTRRYGINPEWVGGLSVTIYAECSINTERINNHHYMLDIYFSVDDYGDLDFFVGVTFGTEQMEKEQLDREIDIWVEQIVTDDSSFPAVVKDYLRKQEVLGKAAAEMWEDTANDEETDGASETE